MSPTLTDFSSRIAGGAEAVAGGLIGKNIMLDNGFGPNRMIYADYVASGRALAQVEDFMRDEVLPFYANSHTEDSACGRAMTQLREAARAEILRCVGADASYAAIFAGAGATAGINKLVSLLDVDSAVTVLIGPYEHHSNILPWREAGATVVEVPEDPAGGVDLAELDAALAAAQGRVIGSFSAMSNVTGQLSDVGAVTARLKHAGALAVWDYAGAGPYLPIAMQCADGVDMDAMICSPHKFIGGPGASGVLVIKRDVVQIDRPSQSGGGTVRFVSHAGQDYHHSLELREEAGTPNVLGDIRAALVFLVKEAMGIEHIEACNAGLAERLLSHVDGLPRIELLGLRDAERTPLLSFRVCHGDGYFNYKLVTAVLSDYFGIQARGGCACAGPYVFRMLVGCEQSVADIRAEISKDDFSRKPGFVRLNLSYLMDEADICAILQALRDLPEVLDQVSTSYTRDTPAGAYRRMEIAAQ